MPLLHSRLRTDTKTVAGVVGAVSGGIAAVFPVEENNSGMIVNHMWMEGDGSEKVQAVILPDGITVARTNEVSNEFYARNIFIPKNRSLTMQSTPTFLANHSFSVTYTQMRLKDRDQAGFGFSNNGSRANGGVIGTPQPELADLILSARNSGGAIVQYLWIDATLDTMGWSLRDPTEARSISANVAWMVEQDLWVPPKRGLQVNNSGNTVEQNFYCGFSRL